MSRLGIRRLAKLGMMGLPALGLACSQVPATAPRALPSPMLQLPHSPVDAAMGITQGEPPVEEPGSATVRAYGAETKLERQALPISLDTVLRLAEEQNPQVSVARAKVRAACAEKEAAAARWLPDIYIGVGYFRHEGGIQLQEGPLITSSTGAFATGLSFNGEYNPREYAFRQVEAARKVWQNQGELSKVSYEQLLDASTTYIDLLAAHAARAVSQELEKKAADMYDKVKKKFDMAGGTADVSVEKARFDAEIAQQKQTQTKLRGQIEAASAKLAYALGLDPSCELVPVDTQMAAFHLIDLTQPLDTMIAQALASGPGVRELEAILSLIQSGVETAKGPGRFVPIIGVQMGEGAFAAGAGPVLDWANRWDMGVQARWNITDALSAKYKRRIANAQISQVQMTYQELRAKLTLGVQEAKATSENSAAQFDSAETLIKIGQVTVKNVEKLVEAGSPDPMKIPPRATDSDVLAAHSKVALAQLNYIDQMREYNKAQLRLLVLLGGSCAAPAPTVPAHDPSGR
jgi:outer membrane protein TolC